MPRPLHFLPEGVLAFAQAGDSGLHAHRAVQLLLAPDQPIWLQIGDEVQTACRFAAIAPQQPHRVRGDGQPLIHLFLDPGPATWRRWLADGQDPEPPNEQLCKQLLQAWQSPTAPFDASACVEQWRAQSLPGLHAEATPDRRIAAAQAHIDADPTANDLDHHSLARRVHLSASRLLALFPRHTGMPVRHYVLWRRLLHAVTLLQQGQSVTAAAHAAGFSDASHLSRNVRQVLGASPSEIRLPS